MRTQRLLLSLLFGSWAMAGNSKPPGPKATRPKPALFTNVYQDECIECGDFEI
jgi:hypothetical protein